MSNSADALRIIALGNPTLGDDAIGWIAARRLRMRLAGCVRIEEQNGEPAALMESWLGAELVLVIDAIRSGAPAGTIHRFEAHRQCLPIRSKPYSSHAPALGETIELARAIGRLPPRILVFGIELKHCEVGQPLSREVEQSLERLLGEIEQEVVFFLGRPCDSP